MPSKSPAQHRLMEAAAHAPTAAGYGGVPRKVGRDFANADAAHPQHAAERKQRAGHVADAKR